MKYIFIVFFAFLFSQADAQNLQFSQVLTYSGRIENASTYIESPTLTVPDGKVWKIETYARDYFFVNNVNITSNTNQGIIWLKSGDEVKYAPLSINTYLQDYRYILSIIEFNIVP